MLDHPLAGSSSWEVPLTLVAGRPPPQTVDDLRVLAVTGRWRDLVASCRSLRPLDQEGRCCLIAYHVLALLKLQQPHDAGRELAQITELAQFPDIPDSIPFAIPWLYALLPSHEGNPTQASERLHSLANSCRQRWLSPPPGSDPAVFRRRRLRCSLELCAAQCRQLRHRAALRALDAVLADEPGCAEAWDHAALVQLIVGDVEAAECSFQRAAQGRGEEEEGAPRGALALRSQGLLHFARKEYEAAAASFEAARGADRGGAALVGNAAVCALFQRALSRACAGLETAFKESPSRALQEALVAALSALYDLGAGGGGGQAKHDFGAWIAAVAPDDFDVPSPRG